MGISGVALGTLIGVTCNHLFILLPWSCRKLHVSVRSMLASILRAHLLPSVVSLALGFGLRDFAARGILQLLIAGSAIVLVYVAIASRTAFSADERRRVRETFAKRLSRGRA
jgi:hypothetical protein